MENDIKTEVRLTALGVTLNELYAEKKQINVHLSDKPFVFTVILKNRLGEYDCKISSFGANLWFRTNKGVKAKQYKTISDLENDILKSVKDTVDFEGTVSFSLSDEIYHF